MNGTRPPAASLPEMSDWHAAGGSGWPPVRPRVYVVEPVAAVATLAFTLAPAASDDIPFGGLDERATAPAEGRAQGDAGIRMTGSSMRIGGPTTTKHRPHVSDSRMQRPQHGL